MPVRTTALYYRISACDPSGLGLRNAYLMLVEVYRARIDSPDLVAAFSLSVPGGCLPYLRNVSTVSVNFRLNRLRHSHVTSFLANHAAMFVGLWV